MTDLGRIQGRIQIAPTLQVYFVAQGQLGDDSRFTNNILFNLDIKLCQELNIHDRTPQDMQLINDKLYICLYAFLRYKNVHGNYIKNI